MRHDFHFYEFHMIASHQFNIISERIVDEGQVTGESICGVVPFTIIQSQITIT